GLLLASETAFGERPALRYEGREISPLVLVGQVASLAARLQSAGLQAGDRLVVLSRNRPEWLIAFFAGLACDAIVVPVNPGLAATEVGYIVDHCAPRIVIAEADLLPLLAHVTHATKPILIPADNGPSDAEDGWSTQISGKPAQMPRPKSGGDAPAVIFYTSGTTGKPKGVMLSHNAELFTARMVAAHMRISAADRVMVAGPLAFIYPLIINALSGFVAGATVTILPRFHPALVAEVVAAERTTVFMGVPTMFAMLVNWGADNDADMSSLRLAISAGQNLAWNLCERFRHRFGVTVHDLWGMTEGTPITGYDPVAEPSGRPESCGKALPGCGVRIVDDAGRDLPTDAIGEVLLSGPNVMLGYYERPEATGETLRDGWVSSGDLGKLDVDGYLYILGRKKDLIIRGGANIYPGDVEEVLYGHAAVAECAVVGRPDELYGERVAAFVVLKSPGAADVDALRNHCRARLADYKVPADVHFLDALPKGPTGKILKRVLRDRSV
ncbi:MAG: AMP-binding protein, partial [Hyphomicrobiaceae bacterium]